MAVEGKTIVAASAVISDATGRFLLVQRGREPAKGLWSLPGGSVEAGESLAGAVCREVAEETGLQVAVGRQVWQVRVELAQGIYYLVHSHHATVIGGVLRPGDDAADAGWFSLNDLETVALTPHLYDFLTHYIPPE